MRTGFVGLFLVVLFSSFAFSQTDAVNIIPKPRAVETGARAFVLTRDTRIVARDSKSTRSAAILHDAFKSRLGYSLQMSKKAQPNSIVIEAFEAGAMGMDDFSVAGDQYLLDIKADRILISGRESGRFYAIQSLL